MTSLRLETALMLPANAEARKAIILQRLNPPCCCTRLLAVQATALAGISLLYCVGPGRYGLPKAKFVFSAFNQLWKIDAALFQTYPTPNSRILL